MDRLDDSFTPVWRTPLALFLVVWMAFAVAGLLAAWRMIEIAPAPVAIALAVGLLIVSPIVLLAWAFWAMMRDPVTGWIAPSALLAFAGAMVPAGPPLVDAGLRLNFESHRPAYEAIVSDAKAGRLAPAGATGWIEGERGGVRFRYRADRPGVVDFAWADETLFEAGVRYDEKPCRPSRVLKCVRRGRPLDAHYFHYAQIA